MTEVTSILRLTVKKKTYLLIALCIAVATLFSGCTVSGPSSNRSNYKTVNGSTQGSAEAKTSKNGAASFSVDGSHVQMTNFAFDADPEDKILAELNEDGTVFTRVAVHDGNETVWQNIIDGKYPETFTKENATRQMNEIYQLATQADDAPFTDESVYVNTETGIITGRMLLTDGEMMILLEENGNRYVAVGYTTTMHGTEDIINAAQAALSQN